MRIRTLLLVIALGLAVVAPASAGEHTTYRCDKSTSSYTGCAVIRNEVQSWIAPGRLAKSRPLVFVAMQQTITRWDAQSVIAAGTSFHTNHGVVETDTGYDPSSRTSSGAGAAPNCSRRPPSTPRCAMSSC